jgi:hypothetical protein
VLRLKFLLLLSVRKMPKNKNKPKKNAAADAPVEQEAGTTEVIAGPGFVAPADAAPVVPADAAPVVPADAAPVAPANAEPAATESADAEKSADAPDIERLAGATATTSEVYKDFTGAAATASAAEPAATASAAEPAATATTPATETQPAEATPAPKTGFLNYIRSFFVDIGGAIHR